MVPHMSVHRGRLPRGAQRSLAPLVHLNLSRVELPVWLALVQPFSIQLLSGVLTVLPPKSTYWSSSSCHDSLAWAPPSSLLLWLLFHLAQSLLVLMPPVYAVVLLEEVRAVSSILPST